MYIETVPNRNSPPAILLRESYREDGKVKKRTVANLSHVPPELIEGLRALLKGGVTVADLGDLEVLRSKPHGHVAAVLGTARRLGLEALIDRASSRERNLVMAMVVQRILRPKSKLAMARGLQVETLDSTLGDLLGLSSADEDDLYEAMDWLLERQDGIERRLARQHLGQGSLVLYDLTSTYFEGRTCPLARRGYSRDGKPGTLQIVFGLLCNAQGCPVAVEVFTGNTVDSTTLRAQIDKVRQRFAIEHVVWVGDRGTITDIRVREDLKQTANVDWITALQAADVRQLAQAGVVQLSLFDQQDLAEIQSPDYPGERLIACFNPLLGQERARKREDLLLSTEGKLDEVVAATAREKRPLRGSDKIGLRVGKLIERYNVAKHFRLQITDDGFHYERNTQAIAEEAALDGIYIIRTSLPPETMTAQDTVRAYKDLSRVERAFRCLKTVDLKVRPIHHRLAHRVRAHIFLAMLTYYVEWHMRQLLAPMLFDDHDRANANSDRPSIVAPARRSEAAERKARTKRTDDQTPVHSFQTLLTDLSTITINTIRAAPTCDTTFDKITRPTPLQQQALDLLQVRL
jgi:hypothetical protein